MVTRATWVRTEQSTAHLEVVVICVTERAHPEEREQRSEARERYSARNQRVVQLRVELVIVAVHGSRRFERLELRAAFLADEVEASDAPT